MSMHDIEGFAEYAVLCVAGFEIPDSEKQSLITAIYDFHDDYDTGFTKLRVFYQLVDTGYFHLFDVEEHPDYEKYKDYFEKIRKESSFEYIYDDPMLGWQRETPNPLNSYWLGTTYDRETNKSVPLGKMCCDAGSRVWQDLFPDKTPPAKIPSHYAMMHRLAELASDAGELYLLAEIYEIAPYLFWNKPDENEQKLYEGLKHLVLTDNVMEEFHNKPYARWHEPDEDFDEMSNEWLSYYGKWQKEHPEQKHEEPDISPYVELYKEMKHHMDGFRENLDKGDVKTAMEHYVQLSKDEDTAEFTNYIMASMDPVKVYETVQNSEYHEKYSTAAPDSAENEYFKAFLSDYQRWLKEKDGINYYINKAQELVNNRDYIQSYFFIRRGFEFDPKNSWLLLIHAYANVFMPLTEKIPQSIDDLDTIIQAGFEHKAFALYVKAMGLIAIDKKDEAEPVMKEAAALDETYQTWYDNTFGEDHE